MSLRTIGLRTMDLLAVETRNLERKDIQDLLLLAHEIVLVNGDRNALTIRMLFHA